MTDPNEEKISNEAEEDVENQHNVLLEGENNAATVLCNNTFEQESALQELLLQGGDNEKVVLTKNEDGDIVLFVGDENDSARVQDIIRVAIDQNEEGLVQYRQAQEEEENTNQNNEIQEQKEVIKPIKDEANILTGDELTIDENQKLKTAENHHFAKNNAKSSMENLFKLAELSEIDNQQKTEQDQTQHSTMHHCNIDHIMDDEQTEQANAVGTVEITTNNEDDELVNEHFIIQHNEHTRPKVDGEIEIGDQFYSLEEVEEALRSYERAHNIKMYKRDVRSIDALLKRSLKLQKLDKVNKRLKYGQLLYCCVYGGKRKAQKIACMDASGVARFTDCHMYIRFSITDDGTALVVNGKSEDHDHDEIVSHSVEAEEPQFETNTGNAEEIRLGAGFTDLEQLYKAIYKYETDNHVHLWRRDGRTIEALAKRAPGTAKKVMETNPGLRFAELRFCCSYGGRQQVAEEKKYKVYSSSYKVGCEMHIRFGVSDNGSQLVVKSMSEEHNHEINEEAIVKEALHPELCSHVSKLVWSDQTIPIDEVKRQLEIYVVREMFKDQVPPPRTRRQYFPSKKQIRYFMTKARASLNITEDVEQRLEAQAVMLREKHHDEKMIFNFRFKQPPNESLDMGPEENNGSMDTEEEYKADENTTPQLQDGAKLLFCHQTPHQQRILKRYNSQGILTQIKDLHSRIPFPLYCMYVQTNVDYQLVAVFILQSNTPGHLAEALQTVKDWNPGWSPKFVVSDCCEIQIEAIESVFTGSFLLVSDESREQTWSEWLCDMSNGVSEHVEEMLVYLRALAQSYSEETLNTAARELEDSEVWKNSDKLRNWFQFNWLAHAKRWVAGYRPDDYMLTRHFGRTLDDELKVFRSIRMLNKASPLQDVIQHLVEHTVPMACKQYYDLNRESVKLHNDIRYAYADVPVYLCTRPGQLTFHVYERVKRAAEQSFTLRCMHPGIFTVQGELPEDDTLHTVSFGDATSFPSCDCEDWQYFKLPCVHFCTIYSNFPGWNFDMMCNVYRSLPHLNVDWACEGVVNAPGILIDNATQTTYANILSTFDHTGFHQEKPSETPQLLATQCRGILQQLSKLQLVQNTKENLQRLKCELKELLSVFANTPRDKQVAAMPYHKSPGRPRKIVYTTQQGKTPSSITVVKSPDVAKELNLSHKANMVELLKSPMFANATVDLSLLVDNNPPLAGSRKRPSTRASATHSPPGKAAKQSDTITPSDLLTPETIPPDALVEPENIPPEALVETDTIPSDEAAKMTTDRLDFAHHNAINYPSEEDEQETFVDQETFVVEKVQPQENETENDDVCTSQQNDVTDNLTTSSRDFIQLDEKPQNDVIK